MKKEIKNSLIIGGSLLLIHTALVLKVFFEAHNSQDGQAVFAYMYFLALDAPTIRFGFTIEQHIGLLANITDWWYSQGHQGINLRAMILTSFWGGLHWFVIGNVVGRFYYWLFKRSRAAKEKTNSQQTAAASPSVGRQKVDGQ